MQIKNVEGEVLCSVPGNTLVGVSLRGANLRKADLREAHLESADLRSADLRGASFRRANLRGANLRGVDLRWSDLRGADLSEANLHGADLYGAVIIGANLDGAILPPPITPAGEFLGYKKVKQEDDTYAVITLRIPADAQRTSALTSRKCRASHVVAVEGEGLSPTCDVKLRYTPGETVYADSFDPDRREECTQGIHFFMTREEAAAYRP